MNERIKQLAIQAAGKGFETFATSDFDSQEKIEKFAELIAKECMSLMKEEKDYYDNPGTYETEKYYIRMDAKSEAFDDARSIIKNHFGVEE